MLFQKQKLNALFDTMNCMAHLHTPTRYSMQMYHYQGFILHFHHSGSSPITGFEAQTSGSSFDFQK